MSSSSSNSSSLSSLDISSNDDVSSAEACNEMLFHFKVVADVLEGP